VLIEYAPHAAKLLYDSAGLEVHSKKCLMSGQAGIRKHAVSENPLNLVVNFPWTPDRPHKVAKDRKKCPDAFF